MTRLAAFATAVERRGLALADPELRRPVERFAAHLRAIDALDGAALTRTLADDPVLRIWGWEPGRHWELRGDAVATGYTRWLNSTGEQVRSLRGDIDRFFPARDALGLDGDLSWLVDRADGGRDLVARRFAWFGSFADDGRITVVDLHLSVHEHVGEAERAR